MNRRSFLRAGVAASWGAAVQSKPARAESAPTLLRLNSNENTRGLSARCREAVIRALPDAGRYPFSQYEPFREVLARAHGLELQNVVLGNGSSEVIQMAIQALALARPGARVVMAAPTFDNVEGYARNGAEIAKVPLTSDHSHDLARMREVAEASGPALVYVCNPNNPTATLTSSRLLDEWIDEAPPETAFLVDEAYFDYADAQAYHSALAWVRKRPGVVVTRTFSKVYGMAGLRLGYGLCHEATAARLEGWAADVNINHFAIAAGLTALQEHDYREESLRLNDRSREILTAALEELEIPYLPSHTNFMMYRVRGDLSLYIGRMREHGVLVGRAFPEMTDYNRVTLGLPGEMQRFVEVLREFRTRGWV